MTLRTLLPVAIALWTVGSAAQAAPDTPLTLAETLQTARAQSLSVLQARQRMTAAKSLVEAARSPFFPSASLAAQPGYTAGRTPSGLGVTTTVSAQQLLWDPGTNGGALALAHSQAQVAEVGAQQAEQDAMLAAATAFYQVLRNEGLARVASESLSQANEHLRLGQVRLRGGTGTRAEVLQLQAQAANARDASLQTESNVATARLTLANALRTPLGTRPLATSSVAARPMGSDEAVTVALAQRPELRAQALRVEGDRARVALEAAATMPSLNAQAHASAVNVGPGDAYVGLGLNWNWWDSGRSRSRSESARADVEADSTQLESLKQDIALEVQQLVQVRDQARLRLDTAHQALAAAREAYRIALDRYRLGLATTFELRDVQTTLLQAENNTVQADLDLALAQVRLSRAMGEDLAVYAGR